MESILWPLEIMRIIDACGLRVLHWYPPFTLHCPRNPEFLRNNPMAIHCLVSFLSSLCLMLISTSTFCQGTLLAKPLWKPENLGAQGWSGGNMVWGNKQIMFCMWGTQIFGAYNLKETKHANIPWNARSHCIQLIHM